ncbi:putative quinol monooxygenase [Neisseria zalophi]|uniref:Antibiotic biosynthesis monooxygenase n=1 Tax=Neisseria zalophi TaxID=640030 RepID=A0A5J6PWT5_9NEIS|nr:putative quinol monooxygenase [Neisseria zalophi]QEY26744.1 antibiotic biosynthesis monooxygenase [Neisseria zalophi]
MSNIKVTAIIIVKPEYRHELLEVFRQLVAASRGEEGNIRYDLHQDTENENRFIFFENWQNQAALEKHGTTAHFQNFLKAAEGKTDGLEVVTMADISENTD